MDDKYISLIAKYLSREIEDNEREVLFELVNSSEEHKSYFDEMENLWDISTEEPDDIQVNTAVAWKNVSKKINIPEENIKPVAPAKIFWMGQLLKIAAVFIGLIGAVWTANNFMGTSPKIVEYQTPNNKKEEITLPDGSIVWLNEKSKLSFDERFETRLVKLEGEAFFDVKHLENNQKFQIQSGETKTTVLGTSFNVRAYPNETQVEVTVKEGKVLFEDRKIKKEAAKVLLTEGESGVYKKKEANISKTEKVISHANSWKTQELDFKDVELSEVIKVMERYFNIKIKTDNFDILDCPYTGSYVNPSLDDVIKTFEFNFEFDIIQNGNTVIFSGEGC